MPSDSVFQSETVRKEVAGDVAQAGKKNIPACDICYITTSSFRHLKQHYEGRKHKQKLKKWKGKISKKLTEKNSEPMQIDVSSSSFSQSDLPNKNSFASHQIGISSSRNEHSNALLETPRHPKTNVENEVFGNSDSAYSKNKFYCRNERLDAKRDRYLLRNEMDKSFDQNHLPYYGREFRFNTNNRSWSKDEYKYYGPSFQTAANFRQSSNKNIYRHSWHENSNNHSKWNYGSRHSDEYDTENTEVKHYHSKNTLNKSDDYDTRNTEVKHHHSKNTLNKPYEKKSRFHKAYGPEAEPSSSNTMNDKDVYTSEKVYHSNVSFESSQSSSLYEVQQNDKYKDKSCGSSSVMSISSDSNELKNNKSLNKSPETASSSSAVLKPCIDPHLIEEINLAARSKLKAKRLSSDAERINLSPSTSGTSKEIGSDSSKEKRLIISENMPDRIARLINPSNQKDKAALNHLITELSKTKKKQNLSRLKLQSSDIRNEKDKELNEMLHETIVSSVDLVRSEEESISPNLPTENDHPLEKNSGVYDAYEMQPECSGQNSEQSNSNNINTADILLEKSPQVSESISKKKKNTRISTLSKFSKWEKTPTIEKCYSDARDTAVIDTGNTYDGSKGNKRKKMFTNGGSKKHRCSSAECLEACINDAINQSSDLNAMETSNSSQITESQVVSNSSSVNCEIFIKKEPPDPAVWDSGSIYVKAVGDAGEVSSDIFDHSLPPVESMMNMFASGMVKVEKDSDFSDPIIDTIKGMDPQEFSRFCSDKIYSTTTILGSSEPQDTPDKSSITDSVNKISSVRTLNMNTDAASSAINDELHLNKIKQNSFLTTDSVTTKLNPIDTSASANLRKTGETLSNGENNHSLNDLLPSTDSKNEKKLLVTNEGLQPLSNESPQLEVLVNKLTEITSFEEKVKNDLQEARQKIREYQSLLEIWRDKKRYLLEEEEKLRAKRNEIIKAMPKVLPKGISESCMIQSKCDISDHSISSTVEADAIQKQSADLNKSSSEVASLALGIDKDSVTQNDLANKDEEDICILSPTTVSDDIAIPVIDLEASPVKNANVETSTLDEVSFLTNMETEGSKTLYELKNINVHETVVNSMLVFEDFLYTCSNDFTAKRFSLKDPTNIIKYHNRVRNVTNLAVENVHCRTLVFASGNNGPLTVYLAKDGRFLRNFKFKCGITSICKGWGKIYVALKDGSIYICDENEEQKLVTAEESIKSISSTYQGRLRVLVTLSFSGQICIRNAENGLLIRCLNMSMKMHSSMVIYNDFIYFNSADKNLHILNISTGELVSKLCLPSAVTGLEVYKDFIFTISYSGLVRCYNRFNVNDMKIYHGAEGTSLTCIHVYQGWVFTGNRKGNISVFHFDPSHMVPCQFQGCYLVFGRSEDFKIHVNEVHLPKSVLKGKCSWNTCNFDFPHEWSEEEKKKHINKHMSHHVFK